jgi:error-prone DNA polymerase
VTEEERTRLEYRISDLSTGPHLVAFYRDRMNALGALNSSEANRRPDGSRIRVAGLVITRQAPSTAGKIRFFTLEDEHGHVNVTIKADVYQRYRREAAASILVVDGVVQSQDNVRSLLATAIAPLPNVAAESSHSHDYR